ncbi:TNT domain-containing protein [Saccharothrix sp. NPDC042600]|uniref:TNT domain-containing protein n=1 Tax=Saccharothrix TaxID=2071 RepID=UPI0033FE5C6A|nr:hypothetical protein GCM10017745_37030 [Saccharothrix mutabilis subsp. capreolus]
MVLQGFPGYLPCGRHSVFGLIAAPAGHAAPPTAQIQCEGPFFRDDERLGPKVLPPETHVVGRLLDKYKRFGNEPDAEAFLAKYWDGKHWKYPSNYGFVGTPSSKLLLPGEVVDRFGGQSGKFLSPIGTPYAQRSLPPQSLNTCEYEPGVRMSYGYYRYKVDRPFAVLSGTTASWFGQPGGGKQFKVETPVGAPDRWNVDWLVRNYYLVPIVG